MLQTSESVCPKSSFGNTNGNSKESLPVNQSVHIFKGKKNIIACAQVLVYTFSSTERGYIQHVWILKLHSLKAEINL